MYALSLSCRRVELVLSSSPCSSQDECGTTPAAQTNEPAAAEVLLLLRAFVDYTHYEQIMRAAFFSAKGV